MMKEELLNKLVVRSCDLRVESKSALQIFSLVEKAFEKEPHSDHREQFLVEKLYQAPPEESSFIPELSLVAELEDEIVGFALLTKCLLVPHHQQQSSSECSTNNNLTSLTTSTEEKQQQESIISLCLAPLAIKPQYHKMGIGSLLMREAHKRAKELGFTSVVLVGHEHYYPRFGYRLMREFGISVPYQDIPAQYCMVIELVEGCLSSDSRVNGSMVQFAKEFSNY
ncbi:GCN5-related N-acetyltransferase [Naegleria gruberi]|uniref:GCN5-related N-acetyltransferase n=1 Tax=Naegleria gruberi TaxID=5762 RepID=D2V996_NAEGR|nr:GCN5-related N-acetyltransferase [Naegleria gruberi]EFC46551.1 GCN5-related N-acetyltransferase [Naegleria gruberi]|eukprot:XP_002679295.1 GCN5-related N-acetyltransferase [Naegleria gruberi strain NEG-M]